jgi:hypothetical protein
MSQSVPQKDRIPRDPEAYRYTQHFLDQREDRVPDPLIGLITDECIKSGRVVDDDPEKSFEDEYVDEKSFRLVRRFGDQVWTVVVSLKQDAFESVMVKHNLVTIYNDG